MSAGPIVNRTFARQWHHRGVAKKGASSGPVPDIGRRLAEAREKAGITQLELAKRSGVRQEALSRFEAGKRGLEAPLFAAVLRAAADAGISVDGFVLRGVGEPLRPRPMVVAQDPATREALIEVLRHLTESESKSDSPPSEPKIPTDKRRKPSSASR